MYNTGRRRELTEKDRYVIEKCMKRGDSVASTTILLGVSIRTIKREVNRGTVEQLNSALSLCKVYKAYYAQERHCERVSKRVRAPGYLKQGELIAHIADMS
jgi:IS30 family transposase